MSILVVCFLIALGINELVKMINYDSLVSTTVVYQESKPTPIKLSFATGNPFMIAIAFNSKSSHDDNWRKYFSVAARVQNKTNDQI